MTVRRDLRWPTPTPTPSDAASPTTDIRPLEASDAPLVLDLFTRLSERSRRLRFLMGKPRLTDAVDHHDHEALVAVSRFDGRIVGGARYIRLADESGSAELAVTVVDDWPGRGLGGQLIARLTGRARKEGVLRFVALVAGDNAVVASMLHDFDANVRIVRREHGDIDYEIALHGSGIRAGRSWLAAG
jgi:GNAT superfamily N-acetyltransferase